MTLGVPGAIGTAFQFDGSATSFVEVPFGAGTLAPPTTTHTASAWVNPSSVGPGSVTCTATDNAGNSASASVLFLVTAMASKQAVLAEIEAELATASKRDRSELHEAARQLRKSLDPSNWVDGNHLRVKKGEHVFENEKEAVQKLRELLNDRKSGVADATLQGWIDTLVAVDRALAQIAIDEATAAGGSPKRLAEAAREMAKAADDLARGRPEGNPQHPEGLAHAGLSPFQWRGLVRRLRPRDRRRHP